MEASAIAPTLIAAALLATVYLLGGRAREGSVIDRLWHRRLALSAAAGVSVAYVFLDILPELAAHNASLAKTEDGSEVPFAEQRIYLLTLLAFVVMYGLQHIVLVSHEGRRDSVEREERDGIYWLHLVGFSAYSALIGYLLVERAERGLEPLVVYTLAMGVHFLVANHSLTEEHGAVYRRHGHRWLAASVIAGWLVGVLMQIDEATFARLFALLAGGVVITSLRAELPDERSGRFWPFCLGAIVFGILLLFT